MEMSTEALTRRDLVQFKVELLQEMELLIGRIVGKASSVSGAKTIRSREVRALLDISASTLQSYRIHGILKAKKIKGTYYYDPADIKKFKP
ncbi:MerR family transcriptional regulator [Chitinophaga horti]|uniref:MerR family transcriptional regulator n=1 Tax=Chitinophaga horti TaxID=2920382 RepID=A0ABY6IY61_9BACT|nr:MerR family transcriptional regulator [Chitinophaga horti]UYQ92146.1 MerR family transcriptional regulator [Chitinophaga horti]